MMATNRVGHLGRGYLGRRQLRPGFQYVKSEMTAGHWLEMELTLVKQQVWGWDLGNDLQFCLMIS